MLGVDDGGAEKSKGLVSGFKAEFGFVVPPGAAGDADHGLAAGGDHQTHWHIDVVDEMLLRVILYRGSVPTGQDTQKNMKQTLGWGRFCLTRKHWAQAQQTVNAVLV